MWSHYAVLGKDDCEALTQGYNDFRELGLFFFKKQANAINFIRRLREEAAKVRREAWVGALTIGGKPEGLWSSGLRESGPGCSPYVGFCALGGCLVDSNRSSVLRVWWAWVLAL